MNYEKENKPLEAKTLEDGESTVAAKYSGKSIAGFVLSLVGILVAAIPCGIIGLVFSALGMRDVDALAYRGKGLAISGLVISIIDIVVGIFYLAL